MGGFTPDNAMKRRLIVCLVAILALLCLAGCASAEDEVPFKVTMELSTSKFTGPKEITVSIQISNSGEADMPGPITLYYPNGKKVEDFGSPTLAVGASKSWSGTWNVTQSQLDKGKITFQVKYSTYNDDGELVMQPRNYSKPITYTGAVASVEVNRTIAPTTARKGQEVTVTYDVVNTGNVDITNVSIKEDSSISSKKGAIATVAAGEKASYTFTTKMGTKDLTSKATITYKANGKTDTIKKDAATIKYGEVKLTADLKADKKGAAVGDTLKLTLTLKNTGNTDYQNVKVTDPLLGEVFAGQTVPAGKSVTLDKEITVTETADYQFTITGQDGGGQNVETATGRVSVKAVDPAQKIILTVEATADRDTIYQLPGTVKFNVSVTNSSSVDVKDVNVKAVDVQLYNFPLILAGETREFTRDVSISMAGQYRFDAYVKNQLDETETFQSNVIPIAFAEPTPAPTEAPIITPPLPVHEDLPTDDGLPTYVDGMEKALNVLYWVFLVLAAAALVLLVAGTARRIQANRESAKAQDHLERGTYRDYTQPAPKERHIVHEEDLTPITRPIGDEPPAPEMPAQQDDSQDYAEDGELMAETLRKLYPRTGEARLTVDPTLTVEDVAAESAPEEPFAQEEVEEVPAEETAAEQPLQRHRRSQRRHTEE